MFAHLWFNQPSVVERDVEQVEDDTLGCVLEHPNACEFHVHIQTSLQLVQDRHGVAHVLQITTIGIYNAKEVKRFTYF